MNIAHSLSAFFLLLITGFPVAFAEAQEGNKVW